MIEWNIWLGVSAGGALGALARAGCLRAANSVAGRPGSMPKSGTGSGRGLLFANTMGCFCIGILAGDGFRLPEWLFLTLAIGFCGSLTTFSTLCAQLIQQMRSAQGVWSAATYLGMSLALGYGGLYLGWAVGA